LRLCEPIFISRKDAKAQRKPDKIAQKLTQSKMACKLTANLYF